MVFFFSRLPCSVSDFDLLTVFLVCIVSTSSADSLLQRKTILKLVPVSLGIWSQPLETSSPSACPTAPFSET